ncbi:hypothetical protein ES708_14878 [subsurface metagenome]
MMEIRRDKTALVHLVAFSLLMPGLFAQNVSPQGKSDILNQLSLPDWREHVAVFADLDSTDLADSDIFLKMVQLLDKTISYKLKYPKELEENDYYYENYLKRLIDLLSATKRAEAIPALIYSFQVIGLQWLPSRLALFGEPVIDPCIVKLRIVDEFEFGRTDAAKTLLEIIRQNKVTPGLASDQSLAHIKEFMFNRAQVPGGDNIRLYALRSIAEYDDPEIINYLREVAENDPIYTERENATK